MKRITILLVLLLFVSALAYGQAGYLDMTFGYGGKTIIDIPGHDVIAYDIAILPDGKIIHSGIMHDDDFSWVVLMRYNSDGTIDSTFGKTGRFTYPFLWYPYHAKIELYPDGRILAYGSDCHSGTTTKQAYILRILPSGVIDSTFADNGMYSENNYSILTDLISLKIRDDGKIVMAGGRGSNNGSNTFYRPTVTLLTSDGHIDTTFGDKGRIIVAALTDTVSVVSAAIADNGLITFGCSPEGLTSYDAYVIRCNMSGVLDTLFGNKGVVTVSPTDDPTSFVDMHVRESGEVYCLVNIKEGLDYHVAILKFTADGKDDLSFGNNGFTIIKKDEGQVFGDRMVLDSNNRIIIAGFSTNGISKSFATALRLHSNGSPDSTFATYGISGVLTGYSGEGNTVAVQKDGKYVVAGSVRLIDYANNLIFRLNNTGTSNVSSKSFSTTVSISLHPTPSTDNCTVTYTLPTSSECTMSLRDESGRQVRTFTTNEYRTAGEHKEELDLRGLAAGVYFLQIETGGTVQTAKLIKQ